MDFSFLAEADAITLQLEKAKRSLETAKTDLEAARGAYDSLLARAEEQGIPKAKLRKLTEERIQSLFESGLLDFVASAPKEAKPRKPRKASTASEVNVQASPEDSTEEATGDL